MARPHAVDLTDDLIELAAEGYRTGLPMEQVAASINVHKRTLQRWISAGDDEIARRDDHPNDEPPNNPRLDAFVTLATAIKAADSRFVQENLLLLRRAATQGNVKKRVVTTKRDGTQTVEETIGEPAWQAAAWLLERRHTAQFGRQIRQEISGPDGGPVQVDAVTEAALGDKLAAYYQGVADGQQLADQPAEDPSGA